MSTNAPAADSLGRTSPAGDATATSPRVTRLSRRTILMGGLAVLVIAAAAWGARWWQVGRFIESTDDAYLQADSVIVAPKVGGYVAEVLVRDNQVVEAGQPLARLDARQYQAAVDEAQATVTARQADVARSE